MSGPSFDRFLWNWNKMLQLRKSHSRACVTTNSVCKILVSYRIVSHETHMRLHGNSAANALVRQFITRLFARVIEPLVNIFDSITMMLMSVRRIPTWYRLNGYWPLNALLIQLSSWLCVLMCITNLLISYKIALMRCSMALNA